MSGFVKSSSLSYRDATKLISSMRFILRYSRFFNPFKINLPDFEASLVTQIEELCNYRKLLKKSAYEQ